MKRKINFNEFKKLGMEFDIEEKTYHIDFIPAPIEEEIYGNFKKIDEYFKNNSSDAEFKEKLKDWIWQTVNFERNGNGEINKDYFFSYIGITEQVALIRMIIELITDRILKMQECFGDGEKKQMPETIDKI